MGCVPGCSAGPACVRDLVSLMAELLGGGVPTGNPEARERGQGLWAGWSAAPATGAVAVA